jgi:hypothetical protein
MFHMFRATDNGRLAMALALGLGIAACNPAESRDAPGDEEGVANAPMVPTGTSMTFTVDDEVTSDGHQAGDGFTATLSGDVADVEGRVVLEAGTKARWTVTEVATAENGAQSLISARLESVQVDQAWHPVHGTITEAEVLPPSADEPADTSAWKVRTGTEAEALVAEVTGGGEGDASAAGAEAQDTTAADTTVTAMGAENDPAPPTIAVAATDGPARIAAGSRITVRLTDTLVLGDANDVGDIY